MSLVSVLPAVLKSMHTNPQRRPDMRHLIVIDPDAGAVNVRWRLGRETPWSCNIHGRMTTADCAHTFAAGLVLAERLLGLTLARELDACAGDAPERTQSAT